MSRLSGSPVHAQDAFLLDCDEAVVHEHLECLDALRETERSKQEEQEEGGVAAKTPAWIQLRMSVAEKRRPAKFTASLQASALLNLP